MRLRLIKLYEVKNIYEHSVMALIGCERCGRTGPFKIDQKVTLYIRNCSIFTKEH